MDSGLGPCDEDHSLSHTDIRYIKKEKTIQAQIDGNKFQTSLIIKVIRKKNR